MKRSLIILVSLILLIQVPGLSQGRFLKNVAKDVKNDLLGTSGNSQKSTQPEPPCACKDAEQVLGMSQHQLQYQEVTIDILDDGSFLVYDRIGDKYYIISGGVKKGPFSDGDAALAPYRNFDDPNSTPFAVKYKEYISKQGDKYLIKFAGKTYGPYARIDNFAVTKSKEKFAATVVENLVASEDDGKKMEEAMAKAKTDAEKMELAMQYSQQMSRKIMAAGGPEGMSSKLITNIEGATHNPLTGGIYNASYSYDDILYTNMTNVMDLKDQKIITLKQQDLGNSDIFINSSKTGYASYADGTLTWSDGKTLSELFSPHFVKADGKLWLGYMYYSPAKDAIMKCKVAF